MNHPICQNNNLGHLIQKLLSEHTHTHSTEWSTWTTKVIGNYASCYGDSSTITNPHLMDTAQQTVNCKFDTYTRNICTLPYSELRESRYRGIVNEHNSWKCTELPQVLLNYNESLNWKLLRNQKWLGLFWRNVGLSISYSINSKTMYYWYSLVGPKRFWSQSWHQNEKLGTRPNNRRDTYTN